MPNYFSEPTSYCYAFLHADFEISGSWAQHANLEWLLDASHRGATRIRPEFCEEDPMSRGEIRRGEPAGNCRVQRAQGRRDGAFDLFWPLQQLVRSCVTLIPIGDLDTRNNPF